MPTITPDDAFLQHEIEQLAVNGETRIGVIYDPYRQELFSACKGRGAWLNGRPTAVKEFLAAYQK